MCECECECVLNDVIAQGSTHDLLRWRAFICIHKQLQALLCSLLVLKQTEGVNPLRMLYPANRSILSASARCIHATVCSVVRKQVHTPARSARSHQASEAWPQFNDNSNFACACLPSTPPPLKSSSCPRSFHERKQSAASCTVSSRCVAQGACRLHRSDLVCARQNKTRKMRADVSTRAHLDSPSRKCLNLPPAALATSLFVMLRSTLRPISQLIR